MEGQAVIRSIVIMLLANKAFVRAFQNSFSTSASKRFYALRSISPLQSSSEGFKSVETGPHQEDASTFPSWAYEERDFFRYELIYQSKKSNARVGRIHTPHGIIDTPGYVAVATNGALKGLDFRQADEAGQQLVFCNSYHLLLHPGPEIIEGKNSTCMQFVKIFRRMGSLGSQM